MQRLLKMKQVKMSDVHYQMLVDIGKKWKIKPDYLAEDLIHEAFVSKYRKK